MKVMATIGKSDGKEIDKVGRKDLKQRNFTTQDKTRGKRITFKLEDKIGSMKLEEIRKEVREFIEMWGKEMKEIREEIRKLQEWREEKRKEEKG